MSVDAFNPITTETVLSLPFNGSIFTTRRKVGTEKPTPVLGSTMQGELGAAWADSRIISASVVPEGSHEAQQIVHARIPTEAAQLATNWQYSTCSMGGQRFPSVSRTVILLASEVAHDTPARGSAMPVEHGSIFDGQGYILMDRQVASSGMQLEPVFRVERRNYVKKSSMYSLGIDPLNGKTLASVVNLYPASEVIITDADPSVQKTMAQLSALPSHAFWGIQADGTQRTYQQLSCGWYSVETSQVVGGTFDMEAGVVDVGSHTSNDPYYWPPVLETFNLMNWARNDGMVEIYPALRFHPDGYNGPCKTTITRTWSKDPFTIPVVQQMTPTRIYYACPYYTVNISECLHPTAAFQCDIGNSDPIYDQNTGSTRHFAATNFTTWPATITAYDDQQPFRGGYLRTMRVVHRPDIPANVNFLTGAAITPPL